jgi:SAM-dependent methyltransferase
MSATDRSRARELCTAYVSRGDSTGWFEPLYEEAERRGTTIPWADQLPNPHMISWLVDSGMDLHGMPALKVGCGLGDDAEYLASRGAVVTAFDISPTAIAWCRRRFPDTKVRYVVADLFAPPPFWDLAFGFVVEAYTLQVLSSRIRRAAMQRISRFVAPGGTLLVICRGREPDDPEGPMPWPITLEELSGFEEDGLEVREFREFMDDENPPVRRFLQVFCRETG